MNCAHMYIHIYIHTHARGKLGRASIALTFWTYLTLVTRSPSPLPSMWPMQARRRGAHASKIISSRSPLAVEGHTLARHTPGGLGAFPFTPSPSSGWAARRRARTRPVRVIARHTLAHNSTATTPFAHGVHIRPQSPAIRYTTGQASWQARLTAPTDHARHYAQLTEECGRKRRPMVTRAAPPTTRSTRRGGLPPTRLF